jgi:hypothetical protein
MLNDDVSEDKIEEKEDNKLLINILTDDNYYLDKTIQIQKLEKEKIEENNAVNILISLPSFILNDFLEYCKKTLGEDMLMSDYLLKLLREYNKRFETQHLTTSSLVFCGKKPRSDVVEKLVWIGSALDNRVDLSEISKTNMIEIIKSVLGNIDSRTLKKYLQCLQYFVECKTGEKFGFYSKYNLEGFHDTVQKALEE